MKDTLYTVSLEGDLHEHIPVLPSLQGHALTVSVCGSRRVKDPDSASLILLATELQPDLV